MNFYKITAAGNDFVLLYNIRLNPSKLKELAIKLCDRHYGVGGDGFLVLNKKKNAYFLDYFNNDGSYAFCGNGTRSAGWWIYKRYGKKRFYINTAAGKLLVEVKNNKIYLEMPPYEFIKKIKIDGTEGYFVKAGTNHFVIEVKDLDKVDVVSTGRKYRYNENFKPEGTNVDFVEVKKKNKIFEVKIRTYEKGVENETYSCSSGIASSFYALQKKYNQNKAVFISKMGERFELYLKEGKLYLSGPVKIVFEGKYYEVF